MFLGLEWSWWLIIIVVAISLPFKAKFMNWWSKRQKEQKDKRKDKWGDEE